MPQSPPDPGRGSAPYDAPVTPPADGDQDPPAGDAGADGLFGPDRRALTVGLLLTVTLVAFESLAVATIMPEV